MTTEYEQAYQEFVKAQKEWENAPFPPKTYEEECKCGAAIANNIDFALWYGTEHLSAFQSRYEAEKIASRLLNPKHTP